MCICMYVVHVSPNALRFPTSNMYDKCIQAINNILVIALSLSLFLLVIKTQTLDAYCLYEFFLWYKDGDICIWTCILISWALWMMKWFLGPFFILYVSGYLNSWMNSCRKSNVNRSPLCKGKWHWITKMFASTQWSQGATSFFEMFNVFKLCK